MDDLRKELAHLLNSHSAENPSNTPDFILAEYMVKCLEAYDQTVIRRAQWYERMDVPGQGSMPYDNPFAD